MALAFTDAPIRGGIGADDRFWEALHDGEFRLCRCAGCGRWMTPAHFRCGACGSWEQDWQLVEPVGTVYSWTRTHMAFPRTPERTHQVPYLTVLVEVDGTDGSKVFGMLADGSRQPRVGDRVRGTIQPPSAESLDYPTIVWDLEDAGEQA